MHHHPRALKLSIFPTGVTSHQPSVATYDHSKQAVGYSEESHLYSNVTAPSPAKILVSAFSPGRFPVQTRVSDDNALSPEPHTNRRGPKPVPSQNVTLTNKLSKDASQCVVACDGSHPRSIPQCRTYCRRRSVISTQGPATGQARRSHGSHVHLPSEE